MSTLTVAALIRALKKMPPRAQVVFVAHDQDPERGEYDGVVSSAQEAPEALRQRGYGVILS